MTETKNKKIPLHILILAGMVIGIAWSIAASNINGGAAWTTAYIKPFGTVFIKLLQMLAIPLIITSIISGIAGLRDINKLGRIGGRTLMLFTVTCLASTILGVSLASIVKPGAAIPEQTKTELIQSYQEKTSGLIEKAQDNTGTAMDMITEMVPNNIFYAMSNNGLMLQVVIFAILFGIALTKVSDSKSGIVIQLIDGLNETFMQLVMLVMIIAPIGVFALIASISFDTNVFLSLLYYMLTVIAGLAVILFILYPLIIKLFSTITYKKFFKTMQPVFLMAFSTSSSAATLPVTMDKVSNGFNIKKEISDFVLSLGTTINMDGTALYQSIAAVFIAQATGMELTTGQLVIIALTATLSAVGAAGIPGAGMITLIIVLDAVEIPIEAIALIMAPDRLLDMFRTVINVAGDACGAIAVSGMEKSVNSNEKRC
ncbi:MAG: dicarboxylate/amino acid:cation symporter [Cytophaga sp.]|uniref:dicarboxylate/amino acid:cation symporter n=1 Tax=Cytophaga sp. TaxID=29535 RepID=UPI003F822692